MHMGMTRCRLLLAVVTFVLAGSYTGSLFAQKNKGTPQPAQAPKVVAAKEALNEAQQRYNEARAEVTKARMEVQKALRASAGGGPVSGSAMKSPEFVQAETSYKEIKSKLDQIGKKLLLDISENKQLQSLQGRVEDLTYKLNQIQFKDTEQKERVRINTSLIKSKQDLKRLEERLLSEFPEYKALLDQLKQAELALKEARKQSVSQRRQMASSSSARDNPAVTDAQATLDELVTQSKEVNKEYMMAKKEYSREVAIATAEYKQFLIKKAKEEQEKRIRDAQKNNRRGRNRKRK